MPMCRSTSFARVLAAAVALLAAARGFAINVSVAQIDSSRLLLTQNVGVYASVTDAEGNPVPGLRQESFSVLESADGASWQGRTITSFTPNAGGTRGIAFLLLIDNSGSMYDTLAGTRTTDTALMRITAAREAVRTFLASMTNPADQVGLVDFNTFYHVLSHPSAERELIAGLLDGIDRPTPDQAYTRLYAGLASASREFAGIGGRKAIIVLSDGENYPYAEHSGKSLAPGNRFPHQRLHRRDPRLPAGGGHRVRHKLRAGKGPEPPGDHGRDRRETVRRRGRP